MLKILTTFDDSPNCPQLQTDFFIEKRPLVLVADDDQPHRAELKELLHLYDIAVLEALDGETALNLTLRECPNLIFINARLRQFNGYETARLIRNIKSFDKTPIIFFSEDAERRSRKKAFAVGASSFHIAPLDFERIDRILEKYLFSPN